MIPTPRRILSLACAALLAPLAIAQAPFTIGNLVVVRIGDNSGANSGAATATFLDEYTPTGTFVQTIALPTAASLPNRAFSMSGTATSEGQLNVSPNGLFLTLAGYDAPVGTAAIAQTDSVTVPRVIARVDLLGQVDTSTTITDGFSGAPAVPGPAVTANIRAAVTDDGNRFWASGSRDGVRFVASLGGSTSLAINGGSPFNLRQVSIFHGDLYATHSSASTQGILQIGTGLPTTVGQSVTLLNGFPLISGPSMYDMFWASPTVVYIADDQTGGGGGIKKWELSAGLWTNTATFSLPSTGCTGITGFVQNGTTTLWVTTRSGNPTGIATLVDTGIGSVLTPIVIPPANARFRGIRRIGLPSSGSQFPVGCGTANIKVTGNGEMGTNMFTSVTNSFAGLNLIGFGVFPVFVPFCNCTIAHEYTVMVTGPDFTLQVVPSWATLGLSIYVQAIDLFAPGGCADPLLTLTEAVSFTVQ